MSRPYRPSEVKGQKKKRMTVQRIAYDKLDAMLGQATKVVERELQDVQTYIVADAQGLPVLDDNGNTQLVQVGGNSKVAMWLIDKLTGNGNGLLLREIEADLSTAEGVIDAAQQACEHVIARQLSLPDAERLLRLLLQYAQMRAFTQIDELRELIEKFENQQKKGALLPHAPEWGRLSATSPTANKAPAE